MKLAWKLIDAFSGVHDVAWALARLALEAQSRGPAAAKEEAAKLESASVRCHECGRKFQLKTGLRLDHPPPRLVPSDADRSRMQGYVIECPSCHKDHFVGWTL